MLGRVSGTLPGATGDIDGRATGVIPAAPAPPLSILDASKQITDKLDSYQTGTDCLSRRVGRRILWKLHSPMNLHCGFHEMHMYCP